PQIQKSLTLREVLTYMRILLRVLGILVLIGGGISAAYNSIILFEGEPYVKKAYTRAHNKAKALEQEIQKSDASTERASKNELVKKYEEALKDEQMFARAVSKDHDIVRRSQLLTAGSVVIGGLGLLLVILSFIGRGKKEEVALPFSVDIVPSS
ncbi:MAG TPA: hypothetical protein VIK24_01565, partial [Pyrinomonadaceae bacterium]